MYQRQLFGEALEGGDRGGIGREGGEDPGAGDQAPRQQGDTEDHIRPHDRLDSSLQGEGCSEEPQGDDHCLDRIRSEGDPDGEAAGVESHGAPHHPAGEKEQRRQQAGLLTEALGQQSVDGDVFAFVEGLDENERQEYPADGEAGEKLQQGPVAREGGGRYSDEGYGAGLGGDDRQARRPPGNRAATEKIIPGCRLVAGGAEAHGAYSQQEEHYERPVNNGEARLHGREV